MGCKDTATDKEIQILRQTFLAEWGGSIYIASWNALFRLFFVTFTVSSCFLLLLVKRQQLFMNSPLHNCYTANNNRGLVKIKYTVDQFFNFP